MVILSLILLLLLSWCFNALLLLAAIRITRNECTLAGTLTITAVSSLMQLIPGLGFILGPIVYLILLCKLSTAQFWPDAILISVVNGLLGALVRFVLALALAAVFMA